MSSWLSIYLINDEEYQVARLNQVELLDEKSLNAYNHLQSYQHQLKRSYNKKVWPHQFYIGDIVLKENKHTQQDREKKGKFEANWLGLYVIMAKYGFGAYRLATLEGEPLEEPINIVHLSSFIPKSVGLSHLENTKKR